MFTSATMDFGSTVGCAAKYFEPSSPFSSAVTNTSSTERRRFSAFRIAAMSRRTALPDPSSMAPL